MEFADETPLVENRVSEGGEESRRDERIPETTALSNEMKNRGLVDWGWTTWNDPNLFLPKKPEFHGKNRLMIGHWILEIGDFQITNNLSPMTNLQ